MSVTLTPAAFDRWPDCFRLANDSLELILASSFGPRIVSCRLPGGENLFKVFPPAPGRIRGGHRLWVAPEIAEVTWVDDTLPVRVEALPDGARLTGTREPASGLEKEIEIRLSGASVTLTHRVTNRNAWPITYAPWALTQMAPGGIAFSGFPPRGEHPRDLLPSNPLVLWAYTDLSDPRFTWMPRYFALRQDPGVAAPNKLGSFLPRPWGAYLLNRTLFVKWAEAKPGQYPDLGCNFEVFTNAAMLELETLAPLEIAAPGETLQHVEHWAVHGGLQLAAVSDAAVHELLGSRIPPQ